MRKYKEESQQVTITEAIVCDSCGVEGEHGEWEADRFECKDTMISLTEGKYYPEYQIGTTTRIDLCPDCFKQKLLPFLKSIGCQITTNKWNN